MRVLVAVVLTCLSAFCQQTQAPLPEGVYRVGNGVTQPSVVSKTDPQYSEEARIAKMSGTVKVSAVVGADGKARDVQVTKSVGLGLDEQAVEAIGTWRFQPGVKDGMPVPVMIDVEVNFRLSRERGAWTPASAVFHPPDGVSRPVVIMAPYPDIYTPAGRTGSVAISFDVNPTGIAENLHIEKSFDPALESEVIRIVRGWKFRPGMKDDQTVSVPCTMEFVEENTP
jgi:TonB family protein